MSPSATLPDPPSGGGGRGIAASGLVAGIAGGLLLWLTGYVGPVFFLPAVVICAILGAIVFGVPGILYEGKVLRERKAEEDRLAAERAANLAAARQARAQQAAQPQVLVVQVAPGQTAPYAPGAAPYYPPAGTAAKPGSTAWSPLAAGAAPSSAPAPAEPKDSIPSWPLTEPLCYMETGREKDVWDVVRKAQIFPPNFIGFTTEPPESVATDLGLPTSSFRKISRIEGEDTMDPGDLERIGNFIERHLEAGQGRVVVLPGLENLVEAGNVRNVRRLLEVLRDLAQGHHGSILVALDPISLPEASVSLLERGAERIG